MSPTKYNLMAIRLKFSLGEMGIRIKFHLLCKQVPVTFNSITQSLSKGNLFPITGKHIPHFNGNFDVPNTPKGNHIVVII